MYSDDGKSHALKRKTTGLKSSTSTRNEINLESEMSENNENNKSLISSGKTILRPFRIPSSTQIKYCNSRLAGLKAISEIISEWELKPVFLLGFGLDLPPIHSACDSTNHPVRLMVFSTRTTAYVLHLALTGVFPELINLLQNQLILKVAVNACSLAHRIKTQFPDVELAGMMDPSDVLPLIDGMNIKAGPSGKLTLDDFTIAFLDSRLMLRNDLRCVAGAVWAGPLTQEMLEFSVSEPVATWFVMQVLVPEVGLYSRDTSDPGAVVAATRLLASAAATTAENALHQASLTAEATELASLEYANTENENDSGASTSRMDHAEQGLEHADFDNGVEHEDSDTSGLPVVHALNVGTLWQPSTSEEPSGLYVSNTAGRAREALLRGLSAVGEISEQWAQSNADFLDEFVDELSADNTSGAAPLDLAISISTEIAVAAAVAQAMSTLSRAVKTQGVIAAMRGPLSMMRLRSETQSAADHRHHHNSRPSDLRGLTRYGHMLLDEETPNEEHQNRSKRRRLESAVSDMIESAAGEILEMESQLHVPSSSSDEMNYAGDEEA